MRLAVIGSGISGIAAARVLSRLGHEVVVYERAARIGGVWTHTYSGVRLQSVAAQYAFSGYPWPEGTELHPTGDQVLAYLQAAVADFGLDVRLETEVTAMTETRDGWRLEARSGGRTRAEVYDAVVVATGLYDEEAPERAFPNHELYRGVILNERGLQELDVFAGKRVAVVGFGKSALDLATFAAERGAEVQHVFRGARWLLPRTVFGVHSARGATARMSTMLIPCWAYPDRVAAALHKWLRPWVWIYWKISEIVLRFALGRHPFHRDRGVRARLRALDPRAPLTYHLRSAVALAPNGYHDLARSGRIVPRRGNVVGFVESGLRLEDGTQIAADVVVPALGFRTPDFPFLPEPYRAMMRTQKGGTQLYRHVIHPRIPRVAFAGFNHASLHTACVEIAMIWYGAVLAGDLTLPPVEQMEASAARVAAWKHAHVLFEPTRAFGVGNRLHHYVDVLLGELGVSAHRKRGVLRELTEPYFAADYAGVLDDYLAVHAAHGAPRPALPIDA